MAESTLSITINTIRDEVARYLQLGRSYAALSSTLKGDIDSIVARGLRRFYYPQQIGDGVPPHEWTFLKPVTTIDVGDNIETTLASAVGTAITINEAKFFNGIVGNEITIGSTTTTIASVSSPTSCTTTTSVSESGGVNVTVTHNGVFRGLPDDFGGMAGKLTFDPEDLSDRQADDLSFTRESIIRSLQQNNIDDRDWPKYAAVRAIKYATPTSPATEGQRYELMVFPIPDKTYTLRYRYNVLPDNLDGTNNLYPYGGMQHGETIIASCLAVAEMMAMDAKSRGSGIQQNEFLTRLTASIAVDRRGSTADNLGYVGDASDMKYGQVELSRHGKTRILYNGVQY